MRKKFKIKDWFLSFSVNDPYIGYYKKPNFGFEFERINKETVFHAASYMDDSKKVFKYNYLQVGFTLFNRVFRICFGKEQFLKLYSPLKAPLKIDYSKIEYISDESY